MMVQEYMQIEVEKASFEKTLEEYEPVGVTSPSYPYFEDYSILSTNDKAE